MRKFVFQGGPISVCRLAVVGYLSFSYTFDRPHLMSSPTTTWSVESVMPASLLSLIEKAKTSPRISQLLFLNIIELLKTTKRTGWLNFDIVQPESISDHMYRINKDHCVKVALVHDMAEALVGDITPVDPMSKEEKHARELAAIEYLTQVLIKPFNPIAADEILELWNEYENLTSVEARFVKDIDKYELLVQCFEYEKKHDGQKDLSQFLSVVKSIKTDEVIGWANDVLVERKEMWETMFKSTPEAYGL
ncbi:hypothetical protein NADFUDRAFT_40200 [Nadsonia fulvescens var. elongata DSM 6958]|uniref:5'-deoxynucleotidase n=1 Tax=Nadsonia fulvescens var. elongata DSM 6958 TaxID=857566 RepID=A0A1E3PNL7_9ASCO|nr:hypothetical protein NADFUDRAFT_40200 [Nadsonia fulvescens var. elongata DSM 6958]